MFYKYEKKKKKERKKQRVEKKDYSFTTGIGIIAESL